MSQSSIYFLLYAIDTVPTSVGTALYAQVINCTGEQTKTNYTLNKIGRKHVRFFCASALVPSGGVGLDCVSAGSSIRIIATDCLSQWTDSTPVVNTRLSSF